MNEYRVQRLKEDLTFAQQRNKRQRQQLANYKKVHEKDLKEIEKLNNIINKALEKSKGLQYRFGYVLDDLIYLLMQGSDSNVKD